MATRIIPPINTKLICSRSHLFFLLMISLLKDSLSQLFEIVLPLAFFIVNGEDIIKTIKSSIPSTCDSSRRIIITSMQDSSQAQLLPFVQLHSLLLLLLTAVLKGAQKSIIGDDDTVHAQSTRPIVQGQLMIGFFSLLDSINQRKLRLRRSISPHISAFCKQLPSIPKSVPISAVNIFLALSIVLNILQSLWNSFLQHQIQPILGRDISDCIRSEQSCNKRTQVAYGIVVGYPSRLYRYRNQLVQIFLLVVVKTDASCPHRSATSTSIFFIHNILPILTTFAEFISRSDACHSWRSSSHILHAFLVLFSQSCAYFFHFVLLC